jgi:hypothetical protein
VRIGDWLSLVGLAIVIWQIWRTGRIANATKVAVEEATKRVGIYNVLLIIPELSRLEKEIEDAVQADQGTTLRRLLKDWRELATDFRGSLTNESISSPTLEHQIRESVTLAMIAKQTTMSAAGPNLFQSTKKVRRSIEEVCVEARLLAAQLRSTATPLGISAPVFMSDEQVDDVKESRPLRSVKEGA